MIEVEAPDGTILEFPDGTPREVMLQAMRKKYSAPEPTEKGMLWPVSKDPEGNLQFDSDAGVLGAAKRAFWLPYEAATGQLQMTDPETGRTSDEAIGRSLEAGAFMSPVNPAVRSGSKIVPGETTTLRQTQPKTPTGAELMQAGAAQRQAMTASGATYPSAAMQKFPDFVAAKMRQDGMAYNPKNAPRLDALFNELRNPPAGSASSIDDLVVLRQNIQDIAQDFNNPIEQKAATASIKALDNFIRRFGDMDTASGGTAVATGGTVGQAPNAMGSAPGGRKIAADMLEQSNANFAAGKRSGELNAIDYATGLRTQAANSGRNLGNTYRQKAASALLSKKALGGFNKAERKMIEDIVTGSRAANVTRDIGNTLGGGGGLGTAWIGGAGGAGGYALGGPLGAAIGASIPVAAGRTAKSVSNRLSQKAFRAADERIRQRSPLFQQRAANAPLTADRDVMAEAVIRALIMSSPQPGLMER